MVDGRSFSGNCSLSVSFKIKVSKIIFGLTVYLSFIWLSHFVSLYMWNFSRVFNILHLLVICKISIMFSIGSTECSLSKMCCANLDLLFPYF
jgi:hypothetical protein